MSRIWILIGIFILGMPLASLAEPVKPVPAPKVEESSADQDKAALQEAASEADKWAASHKDEKPAPKTGDTATKGPSDQETKGSSDGAKGAAAQGASSPTSTLPGITPSPSVAPSPSPSVSKSAEPPAQAAPRRQGLNEMKGKLLSVNYDPKTLRVIVDGGYNVEFPFDSQTSIVNGGDPIKIDDLGYNDVVIVRYSGKELNAIEIERVSKAPRPE